MTENVILHQRDLSPEDYEQMLFAQGGGCATCGADKPGRSYVNFYVDHEHIEGFETMPYDERKKFVRGLLCITCNAGIGLLKENPELLRKAADYLESFTRSRTSPLRRPY